MLNLTSFYTIRPLNLECFHNQRVLADWLNHLPGPASWEASQKKVQKETFSLIIDFAWYQGDFLWDIIETDPSTSSIKIHDIWNCDEGACWSGLYDPLMVSDLQARRYPSITPAGRFISQARNSLLIKWLVVVVIWNQANIVVYYQSAPLFSIEFHLKR